MLEDNAFLYEMFFNNIGIEKETLTKLSAIYSEKITESTIDNIFKDMPQDWMPSLQNQVALKKYLLYRIEHLDDICLTIMKYIQR